MVKNAVPINGLKNQSNAIGTYAMACYAIGSDEREMIGIITIEERRSAVTAIEYYEAVHSISGRIRKGTVDGHKAPPSLTGFNTVPSLIKISDFLEIVKETHQSSTDYINDLFEGDTDIIYDKNRDKQYEIPDQVALP